MNPFCVPFATTNMGSAILAMDLVPYMINDLFLAISFLYSFVDTLIDF